MTRRIRHARHPEHPQDASRPRTPDIGHRWIPRDSVSFPCSGAVNEAPTRPNEKGLFQRRSPGATRANTAKHALRGSVTRGQSGRSGSRRIRIRSSTRTTTAPDWRSSALRLRHRRANRSRRRQPVHDRRLERELGVGPVLEHRGRRRIPSQIVRAQGARGRSWLRPTSPRATPRSGDLAGISSRPGRWRGRDSRALRCRA